jgi:hypothetical protein
MSLKRVHLVLVFASGCATAAMAGWITTELRAQAPADPAVVHLCASADGVLHMSPPRATCAAGQQSMFFRRAANPPADAPDATTKDTTDARIKALQQRIAELEGEASRTGLTRRVPAPFEVVDRDGQRVFFVGEDRVVRLYNAAGKDVVRLTATDGGGYLLATNAAGSLTATIGTSESEASIKLLEGRVVRAELGKTGTGAHYRLQFLRSGMPVALLGESLLGEGQVLIADKDNNLRARISINGGLGEIATFNKETTPVAILTEGAHAGGLFKLTSSDGVVMVDAGVSADGVGLVRTGPGSFMTAAGIGLPGSYIMGKAK